MGVVLRVGVERLLFPNASPIPPVRRMSAEHFHCHAPCSPDAQYIVSTGCTFLHQLEFDQCIVVVMLCCSIDVPSYVSHVVHDSV